jgi:hypothetical protein
MLLRSNVALGVNLQQLEEPRKVRRRALDISTALAPRFKANNVHFL